VEDPAPGQQKELYVAYTINSGRKNEITKKDNDLVSIDAPPARMASGLQIVKAEYGYSGNYTDVTNALQDLMKSDGSIDVTVGFKQVGLPDPNPNKQKNLRVEYTINGSTSTQTLNDGERFKLNAPPLEDTSGNPKLTDHATSFIWILVKGALQFIGVFLQFASGFASAAYGTTLFGDSGVFWWMFLFAGLLIPFFGFIGLPILAFIIRLFRSSNVLPA
jgi:hypothetical protein